MFKGKSIWKNIFISILFLGVLPFDKSAILLYKNDFLSSLISYGLNALTLLLGLLFLIFDKRKYTKNKVATHTTIALFLFLLSAIISGLINSNLSYYRIFSIVCLWGYYNFSICFFKDYKDLVFSIGISSTFLVFLSLFLYYLGNDNVLYTVSANVKALKGVSLNRNGFMEIGLFAILASLIALFQKKHIILNTINILICIYAIILTKSATSLICLIVFGILVVLKKVFQNKNFYKLIILIYVLFFLGIVFFVSFSNEIFSVISELFNRSASLTGRTNIWDVTFDIIIKKPIFGYGIDTDILLLNGIEENDPHNGLLYMILTQGIIGLIFTIVIIFKILKSSSLLIKMNHFNYLIFVFVFIWFIRALVESSLSYTHYSFWILLIVLYSLSLDLGKKRSYLNEQ